MSSSSQTVRVTGAAGTVCVTGAAGYIGSWLVKTLINQGYTVRAIVNDPHNTSSVQHLLDLQGANRNNLRLSKAADFDKAIEGCTGVFHVANPEDGSLSKDPENEVIKPAIKGLLDIMRACLRAKTVRKVVFTFPAGAVDVSEDRNVRFDRRVNVADWAEQEAQKFAKDNHLNLITIIPPLVVGRFITPTWPPSIVTAVSPITGNKARYPIIKRGQVVHLDDLCHAHIFLFEQPNVEGSYICSARDATIDQIAGVIRERYPGYLVATEFNNIPDELRPVRFSSNKLRDLGFQFRKTLRDMYEGAVDTSIKKKFLPEPRAP